MSKELTFADFAAMFRLGPKKITMTKADAVRLAETAQVVSDEIAHLRAENARMRKLVAYLAGTNTDHVQVALAGNPIVCDAIYAEARAALGEKE
jgi:hypothetical protein